MIKKFYPSSAAFMQDGTVITKYDSGCLRHILIRSEGIRAGEIPLVYQQVGKVHEDQHLATLKADPRVETVIPEFKISRQLSPVVEYVGRCDFKIFLKGKDEPVVDETKGCVSKNTRRDVIRKGQFNVSYLAQLVSYLIQFRATRGRIIHAYYEWDPIAEVFVKQEERIFRVAINDAGNIDVDGNPSGFGVPDLLAHQKAAVSVLETRTIADRPDKWNQKYGGPCTHCVFKSACDAYDLDPSTDTATFLNLAQIAADNAPVKPDPVPNKIKKPKSPKKAG